MFLLRFKFKTNCLTPKHCQIPLINKPYLSKRKNTKVGGEGTPEIYGETSREGQEECGGNWEKK